MTYLADEELGGLLVPSDLPESHSARPVPVRLLDSPSGRGGLPGSLGGQLLPGGLPSGGLPGGLLGSCHVVTCNVGLSSRTGGCGLNQSAASLQKLNKMAAKSFRLFLNKR